MTPEGRVQAAIARMVRDAGGTCRKCCWQGRIGAPDLLVMCEGAHMWVEVKAPGEKPRKAQLREQAVMATLGGCTVITVDSADEFRRRFEMWRTAPRERADHV